MAAELLLAFPPDNVASSTDVQYDEQVKVFLEQLSMMLSQETPLLISSAPQLIQVRPSSSCVTTQPLTSLEPQLLDPSVNSISVLLLINRLKSAGGSPIPRPELTKLVTRFLESFDGRQIRYVGDLYMDLIQELVDGKWVPVS